MHVLVFKVCCIMSELKNYSQKSVYQQKSLNELETSITAIFILLLVTPVSKFRIAMLYCGLMYSHSKLAYNPPHINQPTTNLLDSPGDSCGSVQPIVSKKRAS